jgi:hypothetical protein
VDASQWLEGLTTVKTVLDAARTLGLKALLDCSLWHIIDIACLTRHIIAVAVTAHTRQSFKLRQTAAPCEFGVSGI